MPDRPEVKEAAADSAGNRLAEALQQGGDRERIFQEIFELYYRSVYNFFAKRRIPPDQCQDLAQETFLKVHRGLAEYRGESRFETWLFQITANLWRNTLRSQTTLKRERQEVPLDPDADPGMGTDGGGPGRAPERDALQGILHEEQARLLRNALEELPPQMRRCVLLRINQDLRYREIADAMQVSIDTVKAHLYQARQQLKVKLAGYFDEADF